MGWRYSQQSECHSLYAKTYTNVSEEVAANTIIFTNRPGGGSCGCSYTETCNTQFISTDGAVDTNNVDLSGCLALCDNNFECAAFVFQKSTGTCTQIKGGYNSVANSDYVSGPITSGSCGGICTQSYKRDLEGMLEESLLAGRAPAGGKTFVGTVDGQ